MFFSGANVKDVQKSDHLKTIAPNIGSWFIQCGILDGKAVYTRNKSKKVIFGGKTNLLKRSKNKISKDVWRQKRLLPLVSQGEASKKGNRLFDLDIENNIITFKANRRNHFNLQLPELKTNWLNNLRILETRIELKQLPYTVKLDDKFIFITFNNPRVKHTPVNRRVLGIDLNPSNVGISVIEDDKIIFTKEYDLSILTNRLLNSHFDKSLNNKIKHEQLEISNDIFKVIRSYHVQHVFIEDLSIKNKNHEKGKRFNRLINNLWKRGLLEDNLTKHCKTINVKVYKVNPMYSSVIGNLMYDYSDPVNASIEIARRGLQVILEKRKIKRKFYPEFDLNSLKNQWKEYFKECQSWKEIFMEIKNSKMMYRVQQPSIAGYSLKSKQSGVLCFINCN